MTAGPRAVVLAEFLFWLAIASAWWWWPDRLSLMTHILIMGLFALSLDLVLGHAGILTVGHAAFFGLGAYTAGLLAVHGRAEAFSGLIVAAVVCTVVGWLLAWLLVRAADLTRLMITIAVCLLFSEAAHQFTAITGGTDGLQGISMAPLLGLFPFDLFGRTAFVYTFVVVLVLFLFLRRALEAPAGLILHGIRINPGRMRALGVGVDHHLRRTYALSAGLAGVAGALLAQTSQFVSVSVLSFEQSAEILVILVLGGAGRLYGGLLGAFVYMLVRDWLADLSPHYWMLGLGLLLIGVALAGSGGILGLSRRLLAGERGT